MERIIGLLQQKYYILQGPLPVNLIKHKSDSEYTTIDKILSVCGALTNLCDTVVKQYRYNIYCVYIMWYAESFYNDSLEQYGQYHFPRGFLIMPTQL